MLVVWLGHNIVFCPGLRAYSLYRHLDFSDTNLLGEVGSHDPL